MSGWFASRFSVINQMAPPNVWGPPHWACVRQPGNSPHQGGNSWLHQSGDSLLHQGGCGAGAGTTAATPALGTSLSDLSEPPPFAAGVVNVGNLPYQGGDSWLRQKGASPLHQGGGSPRHQSGDSLAQQEKGGTSIGTTTTAAGCPPSMGSTTHAPSCSPTTPPNAAPTNSARDGGGCPLSMGSMARAVNDSSTTPPSAAPTNSARDGGGCPPSMGSMARATSDSSTTPPSAAPTNSARDGGGCSPSMGSVARALSCPPTTQPDAAPTTSARDDGGCYAQSTVVESAARVPCRVEVASPSQAAKPNCFCVRHVATAYAVSSGVSSLAATKAAPVTTPAGCSPSMGSVARAVSDLPNSPSDAPDPTRDCGCSPDATLEVSLAEAAIALTVRTCGSTSANFALNSPRCRPNAEPRTHFRLRKAARHCYSTYREPPMPVAPDASELAWLIRCIRAVRMLSTARASIHCELWNPTTSGAIYSSRYER